ncbi:MAG: hypothetical protein NUV61_01100 [Candidatus Azambacteria bacterium]|nr:hypothetical protein [Candidatus Azambacteria bacterium]
MSRELEEEPKNSELSDFYRFVITNLPEGLRGSENAYPIKIGDHELEAVIFEPEEEIVRIGLFTQGGKYARKTLEISEAGEVTEDTRGVIPDFDLTENEPDFEMLSNEDIASSVVHQIKNFKRPDVN